MREEVYERGEEKVLYDWTEKITEKLKEHSDVYALVIQKKGYEGKIHQNGFEYRNSQVDTKTEGLRMELDFSEGS